MEKQDYKRQLNPKQYEAVTCKPGPLLVFAGAGSGKTRVLTYRIAYLIEHYGVSPREILAVTFTNKAAGEMRERLQHLLNVEYLPLTASTFHSFGVRLLRDLHDKISYRKNFSIYDEAESLTVIKNICKDFNLGEGDVTPKSAKYTIGQAKDDMQSAEEMSQKINSPRMADIAKIYTEYQKRLREFNAFDFDDLIYWPVRIFENHPESLSVVRSRFKHLLVDEYQDTSKGQYLMVKYLAEEHKNLTVVGDDDQSIYSWRGADIKNILNFEKDFSGAKTVKLEQNYRSTQNILSAASKVISNNLKRNEKSLWTSSGDGDKIKVIPCSDEETESLTITDQMTHLRKEEGLKFSDFAILYRTNAQSRALEEGLRTSGIPYVIVGGLRFYERMEIKDTLAYLTLLVNPDDNICTKRVINVPKRGIGDVSIDRIAEYAMLEGISLLEGCYHAAEGKTEGVPPAKIKVFTKIIKELAQLKEEENTPAFLLDKIINLSGYQQSLENENTTESETRLDNIKELVNGAVSFEDRYPEATAEMFLEEVSLLTDIDRWDPESDAVTLMTLHAAKGLEFPVIFITGLEEGLFPLSRTLMEDQKELEEERRLMYVGMTRAKRHLHLSYCHYRRRYNGPPSTKPSRFLFEIPEELIEEPPNLFKQTVVFPSKPKRTGRYGMEAERKGAFALGADVHHKKFGYGVVVGIQGSGENEMVTVSFSTVGRKQLMVKYAGLELA
ncbi:MAG: UvrD-helicase domain-containing protein [candidate division Zixibacteria bacterium]|nr:UvrD-helicase domain-containing protein [candidate division Zixibacteria bacterium]